MNFFKRFFCKCEVDMQNLDVPFCVKCKTEMPRFLDDATLFSFGSSRCWRNPSLDKWYDKKRALKVLEVFKVIGKK
jgi:hypothetical protein